MKALFISDAHLHTRNTPGYRSLLEFLDSLEGKNNGAAKTGQRQNNAKNGVIKFSDVEDLYILGDFFDFWFSTGVFIYPEFRDVVEMLANLKDRGIKVHLCEGNHDFFLADYFSRQLGMEVIREWATINLEGRRVLISHGDTVDSQNRRYLLLRSLLRSSFFYKLQRALPISFLWRIAQISSRLSKKLTVETTDNMAKKMRRFAQRKFKDGFDTVILGHSHKHLLEISEVSGVKKTLALLGDWEQHSSYLYYENGNFSLATFQATKRHFLTAGGLHYGNV